MNGDPYRTPQPTDRRVINRSGQPYARPDEQASVKAEPSKPAAKVVTPSTNSGGVHHASSPKKSTNNKFLWLIAIIGLIAILGTAGWFIWSSANNGNTGINTSRYQAVFLENGQIYFGKLENANNDSYKLTNIYYPQAQSTSTETDQQSSAESQSGGIQLIKLGKEVHGPDDEMFITKSQVLYYENLTADSKVSKLIDADSN